jgi:carbohydrate-binding DOMON domain-containing protein
MPSSYQFALWKQESFLVPPAFFRNLLANALSKVVDLLVESRIRIEAMEQLLVKTNSVAYPLYLHMIENLQRKKAAEVNRVLTQTLKSKPRES